VTPAPGVPLLDVNRLSCAYGANTVLRDVRFSVQRGEAVALLGANGAGKSTLLRMCAGLLRPTAGTVALGGETLSGRRHSASRRAGLIFQKHQLVPQASVLTNVVHGRLGFPEGWRCCWQATAPAWVRQRAMECLSEVSLTHKALQAARSLSGGESQRVAIARVLIRAPDLILADEPTASLDPAAGEEVLQLLRTLNRERGVTTVLATHDVSRALEFTDRVIGMAGGQVVLDAPTAGLSAARVSELYRRTVAQPVAGAPA
jgi:phosphonate transport system ATP-binding protein